MADVGPTLVGIAQSEVRDRGESGQALASGPPAQRRRSRRPGPSPRARESPSLPRPLPPPPGNPVANVCCLRFLLVEKCWVWWTG
jgi:hypothetical protein